MKYAKYTVLFIALFFCHSLFSQSRKVDSLRKLIPTLKDDTNKVISLNTLSEYLWRASKYDTSLLVSTGSIQLADKLGYKKGKAAALRDAGIVQWFQGKYSEALKNQQEALKLNTEIGYKHGISSNLGNIGSIYKDQGDYVKALDYYKQGLKMDEQEHDSVRLAGDYGNIGIIYHVQGDFPNCLEYYLRALNIAEKLGDKAGMGRHLGNIGNVYADEGDTAKALDYYQRSINIDEEIGDEGNAAVALSNMGNLYVGSKRSKALDYYTKGLKLAEKIGDAQLEATCYGNIGSVYFDLKNYSQAYDFFQKGLKLDLEIGNKNGLASDYGYMGMLYTKQGKFKVAEENIAKAIAFDDSMKILNDLRVEEENMSHLYDTMGQYKKALEFYKKSIALKDTLFNKDKSTELARKELNYQFEKKEAAEKAEQDKKDALAEADKHKEHIIIAAVLCGLLLVIVFTGFVLRSLRITRKQKENIEVKNKIIEEKSKEVFDSITYAKRLQDAILPPVSIIKKYLPESFILYKPKDIVAGDFYWMERLEDVVLIAACDCTGHGVPGAMVSVVCSNALNRAIKEFKIRDTGKVLDKVRELVLETFEKSEGEVKDGMDASFCAIYTKTLEVEWSGAYNPLWYITDGQFLELGADKQPIGKTDNSKPFTTHKLQLKKGSVLFLFTDGYADQFGGEKGKKFKYKQLQEMLTVNASKPMEEQKRILEDTLTQWQGNLEQVDDILIMGIRV